MIVVKSGETVGSILRELGAAPDEIKSIIAVIGPAALEGGLKEGQKLRVLMTPAGARPHAAAARHHRRRHRHHRRRRAVRPRPICPGRYPQHRYRRRRHRRRRQADDDSSGVRLYQSLYETALRNNVPNSVIEDLVRIYSYDVDFERKVQPGDSFDVLYADDENGEGKDEVRYAALTVGGETKKYYRFQTADDGVLRLL